MIQNTGAFTPWEWWDDGVSLIRITEVAEQKLICQTALPSHARLIAKAPDMAALIADIEESFTADDSYAMLRDACRKLLREISGEQVSV